MQLAFYKASQGGLWDRVISTWTHSSYCHAEVAFNWIKADDRAYIVQPGDADGRLCFSSSSRDGGTRFKYIDLHDGKWTVIDLPLTAEDEQAIYEKALELQHKPYDWDGIVNFGLPFVKQDPNDWYCSESGFALCQYRGLFPGIKNYKIDPGKLYHLAVGAFGSQSIVIP